MRTNARLYETNSVHRCPEWNKPAQPKYSLGEAVSNKKGEIGRIESLLPAPPTSAMRCREHHYHIAFPSGNRTLTAQSELTPAPTGQGKA